MGHTYIGSEHLLLGLLEEADCAAARLLTARGASAEAVRKMVEELSGQGNPSSVSPADMTPRTKKIIESSAFLSVRSGRGYIGTEHLLLALLEEADCVAVRILDAAGISVPDLHDEVLAFLNGAEPGSEGNGGRSDGRSFDRKSSTDRTGAHSDASGAPTLLSYGRDLTASARDGKLDPIIGRDPETERVIQILLRRTKNNPCLIGEPGVGKTAVVEGLAQRIVDGNVSEQLVGKTVITLDIPAMIAGAKYRGEFEERMKTVMEEVRKDPSIILFIDEIHTLVGAGAAEGAVDAANILKPALARGEMQIIGATTISEYRAHIEKDAAL
jgi:ATP-dependent Clp protease ATP-binding subunit ClpC